VVTACRVHDAKSATQWLAGVPANQRAEVMSTCKTAGTNLEPAGAHPPVRPPVHPPKPTCDTDPMSCRH